MNNARQRAQRELDRARKALLAAKILMENQLYEDCVSRAYYAVLHAAKAALATKDIEPVSHKAVKRMFSLYLVKTGKIEKGLAKILTAEQSAIMIFTSKSTRIELLKESMTRKNLSRELKNTSKPDLSFVKNTNEAIKIALDLDTD